MIELPTGWFMLPTSSGEPIFVDLTRAVSMYACSDGNTRILLQGACDPVYTTDPTEVLLGYIRDNC